MHNHNFILDFYSSHFICQYEIPGHFHGFPTFLVHFSQFGNQQFCIKIFFTLTNIPVCWLAGNEKFFDVPTSPESEWKVIQKGKWV